MSQNRNASGPADKRNGFGRREPGLLDIGRSSLLQKPIEGFLDAGDITLLDHHPRKVRPADYFISRKPGDFIVVNIEPERSQPSCDLRVPLLTRFLQLIEPGSELGRFVVDAIAELERFDGRLVAQARRRAGRKPAPLLSRGFEKGILHLFRLLAVPYAAKHRHSRAHRGRILPSAGLGHAWLLSRQGKHGACLGRGWRKQNRLRP